MQPDNTNAWKYPPDDFDRTLIRDGAVVLFRKQAVLEEAILWLQGRQYLIHTLDAAAWQDKADFHRTVAEALQFPDYYGQNLNALNDCLGDIEVPLSGVTAVVLLHFHAFARR